MKLRKVLRSLENPDTFRETITSEFLMFCSDENRGLSTDEKVFSAIIDSLDIKLRHLGYTVSQMSYPFNLKVGASCFREVRSFSRAYLIAAVTDRVVRFFGLRRKYSRVILYEKILDIAKPLCVIGIGLSPHLIAAARNKSIKTIEILHGIGYPEIPWGWEDLSLPELPSAVFSLDSVSTEVFSKLKDGKLPIFEIPHPLYANQELINPYIEDALKADKIKAGQRIRVLFSLGWGMKRMRKRLGISHLPFIEDVLPEFFQTLLDETRDSHYWLLRLHPAQLRNSDFKNQCELIEELCGRNENCEWELATSVPLHNILSIVDGHITVNSMTCYECALFGVKSYVFLKSIDPYNAKFKDLREEGFVEDASFEIEDCIRWLSNLTRMESRKFSCATEKNLSNALQWVQKA